MKKGKTDKTDKEIRSIEMYHLCMTAHKEVLMRNSDDERDLINLIALAAARTQTRIVVDALMSNHIHLIALTDNILKFSLAIRLSYTKHYNNKYFRKKRLFDKKVFSRQINGPCHKIMAINYVLRNPVHHAVTQTPFSYRNSTANYIFCQERGIPPVEPMYDQDFKRHFFPKNAEIPRNLKVDANGMVIRSSFEEISLVESYYLSPISFLYNMNRRTSDDWIKEQEKDNLTDPPITLNVIEDGVNNETFEQMLNNENSTHVARIPKTDIEVCKYIDNSLLPKYKAQSIYQLETKERFEIASYLMSQPGYTFFQLSRCLIVNESQMRSSVSSLQTKTKSWNRKGHISS